MAEEHELPRQSRSAAAAAKKEQPAMTTTRRKKNEKGRSTTTTTTTTTTGGLLNDLFVVVFGVGFLITLSLNILHMTGSIEHSHNTAIHEAMVDFKQQGHHHQRPAGPIDGGGDGRGKDTTNANIRLGELNCDAYGGPSKEVAREMVYWQDIPEDAQWVSPFQHQEETKYLTFEPDGGGWNNIRMAMESTIGLALAMGRTLVMPPEKRMYLLGKRDNRQKQHFSFVDFYPMDEIAAEHVGLDIISMKEYLETQAMTGNLKNKFTGRIEFPPGNRTDWDGIDQKEYDALREYLRNVTETPLWRPGDCLPAFPASGDHKDVALLQGLVEKARKTSELAGNLPVPVDSPDPLPRLEETLANRKKLCVYDEKLQSAPGLHFECNHKLKMRLLVHFYGYLFFEDWKEDLFMKRFIRDHVRYIDQIQCAAARVVAAIREHARKRDPLGNPNGIFDTFHIRRGDFQFKTTRIPAEEIYENSKDELTPNSTIFMATDERDKTFFDPLRQHYDLLFLDDFQDELEGVNTNYYGMVDQLVASRGRLFFGCWFSTFTGFITRLRGYHSQNDMAPPGYQDGLLPTTFYYATLDRKFELHTFAPLRGGFFNREFPTSWRDINKGIGMLQQQQ